MWEFNSVPIIHCGEWSDGRLFALASQFGPRVMLICGRHLIADGTGATMVAALQGVGLQVSLLQGPEGEPTLSELSSALEKTRRRAYSLVIGVGGGSTLDMAKAVAGLYAVPGDAAEVVRSRFSGATKPTEDAEALPWIAVPTTAGTGSEATHVAVLIDPESGVKASIRHQTWFAKAIFIDPALHVTAPSKVTAAAGMDALTQAIEAHTATGATPLTKALTGKAASLIGRNIVRAYRRGDDLEAREATALGSCMAGIALANARLGAVHGLAHPVGVRYNAAHGLVCAVLLPYVMRYNLSVAAEAYQELAAHVGVVGEGSSVPYRLVEWVEEINVCMGIPGRLASLGLQEEDIPSLAQAALSSGSTKANPRVVSLADLVEILSSNI